MNVCLWRRCEVCEVAVFKYRCPRCLVKSCSLPCVKRHKLTSGCNGQRDKTAFVSLVDFTDLNLLSGQMSFVRFLLCWYDVAWCMLYVCMLVITHSLTSRPSLMTVGDRRWALYCLSSPLLPVSWHLLFVIFSWKTMGREGLTVSVWVENRAVKWKTNNLQILWACVVQIHNSTENICTWLALKHVYNVTGWFA